MVAKNAKAVGSPDVIVIPADVSKLEDCNKIVDETIKHFDKSKNYILLHVYN